MNRPIDEKIVSMKLDNRDFVNKAAQTTGIIGSLTKTLNAIPGVNIGRTVEDIHRLQRVDSSRLNVMAEAVGLVGSRFTTLGVVGLTVLQNIINRATDAGLALTRSLTIDQVTSGFREYELKVKSIKTILANTEWAGTGLDDVKKSLEELNEYADQTVYNFAEMTASIGRFTTAGVKLEDATIAIKGLSNLAAASGSDVNQLNTAMYQMSQMMAAGRMNLMDWNSLVNAGMAGKKMQDSLLATAKAMGINVDLSEGFRNSIGDGWITAEVFLETLKKFGNDKSMIEAATKVRTFTQFLDTLKESLGSGWATSFEHIFGDFDESTKLWSGIAETVTGSLGKMAQARNKFLSDAADMGAMRNIFEGIGNAVKPVVQVFQAMKEGFQRVFPPTTVSNFVKMTTTFKEFTAGLLMGSERVSKLTTIFQGVAAVFSTVIEIGKRITKTFMDLVPDGAGDGILDLLVRLAEMSISFNQSVKDGNALTAVIDGLGKVLRAVGEYVGGSVVAISEVAVAVKDKLGGALTFVMKLLKPVGEFLKETFSGIGMKEVVGAGAITGGFILLKKIIDLVSGVTKIFDTVRFGIRDLFNGVGEVLQSFTSQVKYNNLMKIAVAVGILAVSLKLLESLNTEDVVQGVSALATMLGTMLGMMTLMDKYDITAGIKSSISLIALATAVSIMAGALKKVASLDLKQVITGVGGLVGVTTSLAIALVAMSKWGANIQVGSLQLIALATGVLIISEAIQTLASINTGNLFTAIGALGLILTELVVFMKVVNGSKFNVSSALGIVAMSGAIHIMVGAISKIAELDTGNLITGLITIGLILAEIVLFSNLAKGPTLLLAGVGLTAVAVALMTLMVPIKTLGSMSWGSLVKGLTGITVALVAIAAASYLMTGSILAGLGIMSIAAGLTMLLIPIAAFSNMSWGAMLKGFGGLAIGLAVIAGTALLLSPAIIPLLGFGAALGLMGLAMLGLGVGVGMFAAGMATLAGLTSSSVNAIIAALEGLIKGFGTLISSATKFIIDLGLSLLGGFAKIVPKLVTTVANIVMKLVTTIVDKLPEFIRLGAEFIIGLIVGMGEYYPKIIDATMNMVVNVVNGMADAVEKHGPRMRDAFMRLFGEIIGLVIESGVMMVEALLGWIPGVEKAASKVGETAQKYIDEHFKASELAEQKADEFVEGLSSKESSAQNAGKNLSSAGNEGLRSVETEDAGANFGDGFVSGINSRNGDVYDASSNMAKTAKTSIEDTLEIHSPSRVTEKLGEFTGLGFANGLLSTKPQVVSSAREVSESAGKEMTLGFADGMKSMKIPLIVTGKSMTEVISTMFKSEEVKEAGEEVGSSISNGIANTAPKVEKSTKAATKAAKTQFELSKDWIDERKYYNELSLKAELSAWERLQAKYKKGTEDRKQADREVYRLKNELVKAEFENSKRWIDDRKNYNELSLTDELAVWEKVQARYKVGTEERKEADREVYRVKNEINAKLIQLNEEYTSKVEDSNRKLLEDELELKEEYEKSVVEINDRLISEERRLTSEYERALTDRTRSLVDFAGLFDEIPRDNDVSGKKLIDNLQGQVETFINWTNDINRLSQRGLDQGLVEELRSMGPRAAAEVGELNNLTDEQLTRYAGLWKTKNELASKAAAAELEGLRVDTYSKIEQLRSQTSTQLDTLKKTWQDKTEELRKQTATQLDQYKAEWIKKVEEISKGTKDQFVSLTKDMKTAGSDTIKGMMSGMESMEGPLLEKARAMAKAVAEAIKSTLKIKSPSRVTRELGEFTAEGLAVGLISRAKSVGESARGLATEAKRSLSEFLGGFNLGPEDNELHFKAVIDYDNLDTSRFGKLKTIGVAPDVSFTNGMVSNLISKFRQNGSNNPTNDQSEDRDSRDKRPIIIQSVLNGRIIAEETIDDTESLFSDRTNLAYNMRGV